MTIETRTESYMKEGLGMQRSGLKVQEATKKAGLRHTFSIVKPRDIIMEACLELRLSRPGYPKKASDP